MSKKPADKGSASNGSKSGATAIESPKVQILPETKESPVSVEIKADWDSQFPTTYANIAHVSHSTMDICIDFGLVAPPHKVSSQNDKSIVVRTPIMARIVIPPDIAESLAKALTEQKGKFDTDKSEGRLGLIRDTEK